MQVMDQNNVLLEIKDGIAIIRMNRPEVFNVLNMEMAKELNGHLDTCASDNTVRAILITGEGNTFCKGTRYRRNSKRRYPSSSRFAWEAF